MRARPAWKRAQDQARRAQAEPGAPPPAPQQDRESGRDWDQGPPEYQQRQALRAAAEPSGQAARDMAVNGENTTWDPEAGTWRTAPGVQIEQGFHPVTGRPATRRITWEEL